MTSNKTSETKISNYRRFFENFNARRPERYI